MQIKLPYVRVIILSLHNRSNFQMFKHFFLSDFLFSRERFSVKLSMIKQCRIGFNNQAVLDSAVEVDLKTKGVIGQRISRFDLEVEGSNIGSQI